MKKTIVSKFGGTSMGSLDAMKKSATLCFERGSDVVVVSAVTGVTDLLLHIYKAITQNERNLAKELVLKIKEKHQEIHDKVIHSEEDSNYITALYQELDKEVANQPPEPSASFKDHLLSFGERLSSVYFSIVLKSIVTNRVVMLVDARDLIITNSVYGAATPLAEDIKRAVAHKIFIDEKTLWLTQGFIGRDSKGFTTTLGRGGSDYSAALLAEALEATELEIWTDVSGVFDLDPLKILTAKRFETLDYDEALKLALNGAKVIHPGTIFPTKRAKIPVYVSSTFNPEMGGTIIR